MHVWVFVHMFNAGRTDRCTVRKTCCPVDRVDYSRSMVDDCLKRVKTNCALVGDRVAGNDL